MGKTSRWLKSLLGFKRDKQTPKNQNDNVKDKRRWSFTHSRDSASAPPLRRYSLNIPVAGDSLWLQDHSDAIAVAAAADAALAAAQAAMAVVRLTTMGRSRARIAALKIQTVFRGFLARKALRALKGMVKLQAHVRGFLVRKRAAATLHSMQALVRAQAAARWHNAARRSIAHDVSPKLPSDTQQRMSLGQIPEKYEEARSEFHSKRVSSATHNEDSYEDTPKTVEIDTYNPKSRTPSHRPSYYYYAASEYNVDDDMNPMPISGPLIYPVLTPSRLNDLRQRRTSTAHSTPRFANNMSVCGDGSFRSQRLSGSYQRNYMANTQSFEAKSRSQSAPRQRPPHPSPSKKRMECLYGISGSRMHRSFSEDAEPLHF